ncbi:MAG: hypothetical protein J1E63_05110, partial [Muribaculaceae bacterium]|nr:hypothetical protein [Muribaculaceae bacterium]
MTVKTSDEKKGKVYVSTKSTNSPAYDTWASADNSGDDKQTYYLYAQPAEGLVLDYWSTNENGSGRTVEGTATTYAVSATSEDQNNPTTVTLYAFFKDTPPVSISVNDDVIGAVTFSNPANNVLNKSLTIVASYKMPAKWTNTEGFNVTSKSVKFDGWFKKDTKECV